MSFGNRNTDNAGSLPREEHSEGAERFASGIDTYQRQEYDKAADLLQVALQIRKTQFTLDPPHAKILECKFWLGRTQYKRKKYGDAYHLLLQAVKGRDRYDDPDPLCTLEYRFWLGRASLEHEEYFDAEFNLQEVLEKWEDMFADPNDQRTLKCKFFLGKMMYRERRYRDAEFMLRAATDGQEQILGTDHRYTIQSKGYLALTLDQRKDYRSAKDLLLQVKAGLARIQDLDEDWISAASELLSQYQRPQDTNSQSTVSTISPTSTNLLDNILFSGDPATREPYTDSQIHKIAILLQRLRPQWSKVPRTYMVVRMIGHLDILDELISAGFSDYLFPVKETMLRKFLEPNIRAAFFQAQRLVLTDAINLEKAEEGSHCNFSKKDSLPFEELRHLGTGTYGDVHVIRSSVSFKEYARKRVARRFTSNVTQFIAEIQIIKRVKHHHVVRFVGSYTDPIHIGLIMSPVAHMDLNRYLQEATEFHHAQLRRYFGCLAYALDFLHSQKVRHKDIKPSNILVEYNSNVLFTDFGLSHDFTDASGSTTNSMMTGGTPRYSSPEVLYREPANTKSDIWSLGVVYMDIILKLKGKTRDDMDTFFERHGLHRTYISTNVDALPLFISELEGIGSGSDNKAIVWVQDMLQVNKALRPSTMSLIAAITASNRDEEQRIFCCDTCLFPAEDFSDDEQ
jgi:tRNA A-37 threonylcarbamoyl transferase component Bud32